MGLFDRFKSAGQAPGSADAADAAEQEALRLLEEGIAIEQAGSLDEALQHFDAAIRLAPKLGRAHFCRGNTLLDQGNAQAALDAYATALTHKPDSAAAHYNMGNACVRLGRHEDAVAAYRKAIALKPDFTDAEVALGGTLEDLGKPDEAAAHYRRALEIRPDYAEVHYNLGRVLGGKGQLEAAIISYRRAIEIRPDYAEAYINLGAALKGLRRFDEAAASYRRAREIKPDNAEVYFNEGVALQELEQLERAEACYRRALEIEPDHTDACNNLGVILVLCGQLDEAVKYFRRALANNPDNAETQMNLGYALADLGLFDAGVACTRRALQLNPDYPAAHNNLLFIHNYLGDQPAALMLADARRFGESAARLARPYTTWPNPPEPERCLRVGLVSGDLCNHPVGYFLVGVLEALTLQAAGRLEIFGYANRPSNDETGQRIKACCRGWHSAMGLSDEALARRIRDDAIDILIDLSGHTVHNRLPVFAWRPAPVQMSWLGYFATTGVAEMDYFVADAWTLPASEEINFTEKVWRLPETRLCFTPPEAKVGVGPLPALDKGYVTFGCFNNLTKMNDAVVALWARVMASVPNSRLFLKSRQFVEASVCLGVAERFAAHGIDAGRLILEGYVPRANYLAAYQRVDIGLDPSPYPGGTTTVEALWMGVPVLTLAGERFLSRQGVGLLMNAGLPEWVASSPDDYVARAVSHASDLQRLAALRNGLRQQVLASPIFDAKRFAMHFENALRNMWRKWCDKPHDAVQA
ncbi:MAG: tetratricopeptide repeat protein [Rhodocyclaceae bacterium]|nr:tetratricopeptide repeat protein [Rhodocyclaceae bacterium]